jgi:uroporphyrinogen-III synthase
MPKTIGCARVISKAVKEKINPSEFTFQDKEFIHIEILKGVIIENSDDLKNKAAVFTSANAVRGFVQLLKENNIENFNNYCYCIDGRTSKTALEYGFKIKKTGYSGKDIARKIVENKETNLIHYTSNLRRKELSDILKKHSIVLQAVEVYSKKITPHELENIDAMIFFSPSQIDSFYLKNNFDIEKPAFCIGLTTANYLKSKGHKSIIISEIASEQNIIEKTIKYFNI